MKVYALTEPKQIDTREEAVPSPGPGQVLIRVHNVGICGSDIHMFNGTYNAPVNYPILFGHEWSGVVEQVGEGVSKVAVGDKVTGDCSKYCGHCDNCENDRNLCREIEKFGITVDGATAEYIVRDETYIYKAPADIDMKLLALTEPIAVAKNLLEKIRRQKGDLAGKRILVYGGGAIGQAALLILTKEYGCTDVYLSDLIPYRMEMAKKFGAKVPTEEDLSWPYENDYHDMYNKTTFDVIVETTGVAPVFVNALNLVRPSGVIGCAGMIGSVDIPQKLIVTKSLTVIGSIGGTDQFESVMDFIHANADIVREMVSHEYTAAEIPQAIATAMDPQNAMKVSISLAS